jgi:cell division control protein 6
METENDESQVATPTARRQYADGYKALKAALKCSSSGHDSSTTLQTIDGSAIIGRDQEKAVIRGYLTTGELVASEEVATGANQKGLYISGPPGTGKTATVCALISEFSADCRVAFINCMGLVGKKDEIWSRIAAAWGFDEDRNGKEKSERSIERGLRNAQPGLTL